ncbi:MAG TPA: hypothetical protein VFO85_04855 [Vicinamibacteria bacterium]|nr:hypothetical protein [Vicinamibacteria bacterium]
MNADPKSTLIRRVLAVNAATSAACAAAFLVAARPLGALLGCTPGFLYAFGAALLAFAVHLALVARKPAVSPGEALYFAFCDAAYVAGSAIVLLGWPHLLSGSGRLFFALVADLVALFCILEFVGYRRLTRARQVAMA